MTEGMLQVVEDTRCRAIHSVKGFCDCEEFQESSNRQDGMKQCRVCGHTKTVHQELTYGGKR